MKLINNIIGKSLVLLILVLASSSPVFSTHIVGGDMTYTCLGNDLYEIELTVRRDCDNGEPSFDNPASVGIFDSDGNILFDIGIAGSLLINFSADDTLNTFIESDCGFLGSPVCVHETIYKKKIRLPQREGGYILAYQRCCRNETLTNILDPLNTGSTYLVEIKESALTADCNSSPKFKEWADIYICANEPLVFDHSATDADGDVLVYSLCLPSDGATLEDPMPQPPNNPPYGNATFKSPYTLSDMMGGVPLVIDPNSGIVTATPNLVGQFLIGICVDEYRDGVLLSRVRRDFEYNVRVCGVETTALFEADSIYCGTSEISFNNTSVNADTYQWYFDYPSTDAAFTSTEVNPTFNFAAPGEYTVVLEATRTSDGCSSSFTKIILITEDTVEASFEAVAYRCGNSDVVYLSLQEMTSVVMGMSNVTAIDWVVTQGVTVINLSGATATTVLATDQDINISLSVMTSTGCQAMASETIAIDDIDYSIILDVSNSACDDDSFEYTVSASDIIGFANSGYTWTVLTDGNTTSYSGNPIVFQSSETSASITISTTLSPGCEISQDEKIDLGDFNPEIMIVPSFYSCNSDGQGIVSLAAVIDPSSSFNALSYQWNITSGNSNSSFIGNPIMATLTGDDLTVNLTVISESGCEIDYSDQIINVTSLLPQTDIVSTMNNCSSSGEIDLNLTANVSASPGFVVSSIDWTIVQNGTPQNFTGNPVIATVQQNEVVTITALVNYENGCSLSSTENLNTSGGIQIDYTDGNILCKSDTLLVNITGQSGYTYLWEDSPFIELGNNTSTPFIKIPTDTAPGNYTLSFTVSNNSGCSQNFEYNLTVEAHVILMSEVASLDCDTYEVCFNNISNVITDVNWVFSDDDGNVLGSTTDANPCITFPGIGIYHITLEGVEETCSGIPFILCVTFEDHDIEIENYLANIDVCSGQSITLSANSDLDDTVISWCDLGNPELALANGGSYTFIPVDGQQIVAKIVDQNSCTTTSQITTFSVDVIDLGTTYNGQLDICAGDVYTLDLFNSLSGLSFVWESHSLITSGNTSASPTFAIPTDSQPAQETLLFTVTDANGCSQEFDLILNILQSPNFNFTWERTDCDLITVCFTSSYGSSGGLLWDFGDPNSTTDSSTSDTPCYTYDQYGQYVITLNAQSSVGTCAGASTQTTIDLIEPIVTIADITVTGENVYCAPGDVTLTATPSGPGVVTWYDQSGVVFGTGLMIDVNPEINETVSVGYTDQWGCESALTSTTLVDGSLELVMIQPLTLCAGVSGNANVSSSQNLTFVWASDPHIVSGNNTANPVIQIGSSESAGSFNLNFTATNEFGCSEDFVYEVVILDSSDLGFTFELVDCDLITVCFTPTATSTSGYNWDFGDPNSTMDTSNEENPCYTYNAYGNYTVTVGLGTITGNCIDDNGEMTISLVEPTVDIADITVTGENIYCESGDVTLTATPSGPGVVTWYDQSGVELGMGLNIDINPIVNEIVYVGYTDQWGCESIQVSTTLTDGSLQLDIFEPLTICPGDAANAIVFTGQELTFLWEDDIHIVSGNDTADPLIQVGANEPAGSFELNFTVTNQYGCSDNYTYEIVILDSSELSFTYVIEDCETKTVCFSNTSPMSGVLIWNFGDPTTTNDISPDDNPCYTYPGPGVYEVTLSTISNNCLAVPDTMLIELLDISVDIEHDGIVSDTLRVCDGLVQLEANVAIGGLDMSWCDLSGLEIGTGDMFEISVTDTTQVVAKATDATGCIYISDMLTIISESIELEYESPLGICRGEAIMLEVMPTQGLIFLWEDSPYIIAGNNTSSPTILVDTSDMTNGFVLNFTSENALGCIDSFEYEINVLNKPVISFDYEVTDCDSLIVCFETISDTPGISFWNFGNLTTMMDTSSLDNPCYDYPGQGTYIVSLTFTDALNNMVTYEESIVIDEAPVITIGSDIVDQEVCFGDTITLMASSNILGIPLQWCDLDTTNIGTGNSLEIVITQDTSIIVKAFNNNDCIAISDTIDISVFEFDLEFENDPVVICPDNTSTAIATIINNNPLDVVSYVWSPAECIVTNGDTASEEVTAEESKDLLVMITHDSLGCSTEMVVPLKISDLDISATDSVTILLGEEVVVEVFGTDDSDSIIWSNGSGEVQQTLSPEVTTTFVVIVIDECGCQQTETVVVTVLVPRCDEEAVFVPTAFTPNNDGVNDVLFVRSLFLDEMEITIYDRWGKEVFKANDIRVGWDGTLDGKLLSPDVFAYCLKGNCINGEEILRTGNISLLR